MFFNEKKSSILSLGSILSLVALLVIFELWSNYTRSDENTVLSQIKEGSVFCRKNENWFELGAMTKGGATLTTLESYSKDECELWKAVIPSKNVLARHLSSNGLIIKLETSGKTIYLAEKSYFNTIWAAFFIWSILLVVVGLFLNAILYLKRITNRSTGQT